MTRERWYEDDGRKVRLITEPHLACPFCASRNLFLMRRNHFAQGHPSNPNPWEYAVLCVSCSGQGGWAITEPDAIKRWNLRPPQQGRKL